MVRQRVQQRGVDLEQTVGAALVAGTLQTVVNHRGDLPLVRTVGLLFNQGCNGDDLLQIIAPSLRGRQQFVVQLAVKVGEHLIQRVGGLFGVDIELVGVREEIALQPADVLGVVVDEAVIEFCGLGGLCQLLLGTDAVFRQQMDDLPDRIALGDRDTHRFGSHVAGGAAHAHDQSVVVHVGVQLIGAHADLLIRVGNAGVETEEPLVFDESRVLQLLGHRADIVLCCHLHRDRCFGSAVKGAEV